MQAIELKVYEIFKTRFNEQEATTLIEFIDSKVENRVKEKTENLATKQDLSEMKSEIIKWMVGLFVGFFIAILGTVLTMIKLIS